ncbi:AAA family ATPase [Nocardioides dongxiaopingii]|uniref:AAA family ATPase n=1 Tax=Nocardioides dongxiaopingii TaxID=2576036 RepID=UPI0010C76EC4|nr:AAA family ATPase [Nocardioides dongxiaopingii]
MTGTSIVRPVLKIGAQGIKSIRDYTEIEVAPLTVLAGANSSGKSSLLQPFLMVKQTLEAPYDPGPLLINGANTSFSAVSEMLWHGSGRGTASDLKVMFDDGRGGRTTLTFSTGERGMNLVRQEVVLRSGKKSNLVPGSKKKAMEASISDEYVNIFKDLLKDRDLELNRWRSFFQVSIKDLNFPLDGPNAMSQAATSLIHLPGLRDVPERFYPATEVSDVYPGVFQPYVASVIAAWENKKDPRLAQLGNQLSDLGLTWKVRARRLDDTRVALVVGRLPRPQQGGALDLVNIADVGLGVSQTLPILVALLAASPGQIVLLEQPEIHLHPRAQVALADVLLDAARRGVYVVTETHSNLLLRAIQERVASDRKMANMVRLHWFSRDYDGVTNVSSSTLDENGAFGDWPVDFADIELDIEDRYLNALANE